MMRVFIISAAMLCITASIVDAKCRCDGCDCSNKHRARSRERSASMANGQYVVKARHSRRYNVQPNTTPNTAPNRGYNPYGADGVQPLGGVQAGAAGADPLMMYYWEKECSQNGCVWKLRSKAKSQGGGQVAPEQPKETPKDNRETERGEAHQQFDKGSYGNGTTLAYCDAIKRLDSYARSMWQYKPTLASNHVRTFNDSRVGNVRSFQDR